MNKHIILILAYLGCMLTASADDARELSVMTFNLHAGSDAHIDSIARIIMDEGADLVALQEVDVRTYRRNAPLQNGRNMIADLASATGMFPLYGRTLDFAGGYYGIGLLSRYPIVSSEVVELPNPSGYEPRALVESVCRIDKDIAVVFASTHLCVEDTVTRALQARFIADRYADTDDIVILGGDFNSVPGSEAISILGSSFDNVSGTAPTFPAAEPVKKLDYIFVRSKSATLATATHVVNNRPWASDHRPVVIRIVLTPSH